MPTPFKVALISPGWTIWQHRLLSGALRFADAHPRFLIRVFAPSKDLVTEAHAMEAWGADGAFGVLEANDLDQFLPALRRRLPLVNCALAKEAPGVVTVLGDFAAFAKTGVDHLRQLGLRSLALLLLEDGPQVKERLVKPFLEVAKPADPGRTWFVFPADRDLLWNPENKVAPVPGPLAVWLQGLPKPVGVLTPHLGGGGYLIRCCQALGLRVPEDVAVVGSDETDLSLATTPSVTSVLLSMETIGYEALGLLSGLLTGTVAPEKTIRLKCMDLIVRESTGLRRPEICDIAAALECIRQNATHGITVEQVIRQTQRVSKVTFHRRFREVVGKSPAQAIRERQLNEVRRLLTTTGLPINMVADLSGFGSHKVLTRVFRTTEGLVPREYRRRHQLPGAKVDARTQAGGAVGARLARPSASGR